MSMIFVNDTHKVNLVKALNVCFDWLFCVKKCLLLCGVDLRMKSVQMKITLLLVLLITFANGARAQENVSASSIEATETLQPLDPVGPLNTGGNWFVQAGGGVSAFIGNPLGCADLFDRCSPVLSLSFGKWFTPSWGAMVGMQGLSFKDCSLTDNGYVLWRSNLMYNLTGNINLAENGQSRWDVVPYAGTGLVWNTDAGNHPFSLTYGLLIRRRVANRVHLCMDLSGMTTFGDFDEVGGSDRLDNMLAFSCGLSVTIGRAGWRRTLPAITYMVRDGRMVSAKFRNETILGDDSTQGTEAYPRNDYSGLNSLRRRMRQMPEFAELPDSVTEADDFAGGFDGGMLWTGHPDSVADEREIMSPMANGLYQAGAPVCFFFQLATDKLTDQSQQVNLDALAEVIRKNNMLVTVTGYADSSTGTSDINDRLSRQRADYIRQQLVERGVDNSSIETRSEGGTDRYLPQAANRCAKVEYTNKGL